MVNPGGPGMPAARLATELGADMQAIIGDEFDIVGFDPRGMGRSDPRISCFGPPPAYRLFRTNTVLERGVEVAANVTDRMSQDRLRLDLREWDALTRAQYELCAFRQSDKLRYVGTSYVARDIDYITTLIEGKDALM
jgi:pimeloyl-ACP methyl ester carboxylesterase